MDKLKYNFEEFINNNIYIGERYTKLMDTVVVINDTEFLMSDCDVYRNNNQYIYAYDNNFIYQILRKKKIAILVDCFLRIGGK